MTPIHILIADDHPMFRFGLRALLAAEPGTEVVGEATNGEEAVSMAARLKPDLVLMDVNLPLLNGIEATQRIVAANPEVGVLVITMFEDDTMFAAMRAGARGYILKGAEGEETLRAIHAAANGESIFSPTVAQRLAQFVSQSSPQTGSLPFQDLTPRERDILKLLALGIDQCSHRGAAFTEPQDGPQSGIHHFRQAAGGRPVGSHYQSPRRRPRHQG